MLLEPKRGEAQQQNFFPVLRAGSVPPPTFKFVQAPSHGSIVTAAEDFPFLAHATAAASDQNVEINVLAV